MALSPQFGSIVPSQVQEALSSNFLSFNGGANPGDSDSFAQQYLPEIYEAEVERYGNRTLSGFLRMVGAELPMTSDQVIWSEQNRLHISYDNCTYAGGTPSQLDIPVGGAGNTLVENVISINDTVVIMDTVSGVEGKAIVTARAAGSITIQFFDSAAATLTSKGFTSGNIKVFVYGSAYSKGRNTDGTGADAKRISVDPSFTQFANSPVIIRSSYEVNGSDMAQIGWVDVASEDGASGYLWYLKAESETRLRFEDYLEMAMVEGELNASGAGGDYDKSVLPGSQGLFAAIEERGNVQVGFTAAAGLDDFDAILDSEEVLMTFTKLIGNT